MSNVEEYLKILELDNNFKKLPKAEQKKALTAAWKKFSLKYHPDINKTSCAESLFKSGNEANEILKEYIKNGYFENNSDVEFEEENAVFKKYYKYKGYDSFYQNSSAYKNQSEYVKYDNYTYSDINFKKVAMTLVIVIIAVFLILKTENKPIAYHQNYQAVFDYSDREAYTNENTTANNYEDKTDEYINQEEQKAPDWSSYVKNFEKDIQANWAPPESDTSKNAEIAFVIAKDGSLLDNYIKQSSGDDSFDRIALEAVNQAAPFDPLPKEYEGESIPAEFIFEYNVKIN